MYLCNINWILLLPLLNNSSVVSQCSLKKKSNFIPCQPFHLLHCALFSLATQICVKSFLTSGPLPILLPYPGRSLPVLACWLLIFLLWARMVPLQRGLLWIRFYFLLSQHLLIYFKTLTIICHYLLPGLLSILPAI